MMRRKLRRNRVYPLLNLSCEWVKGIIYPYRLRVGMMNGRFVSYCIEFKNFAPHIVPKGWEYLPGKIIGYQYKESPVGCSQQTIK